MITSHVVLQKNKDWSNIDEVKLRIHSMKTSSIVGSCDNFVWYLWSEKPEIEVEEKRSFYVTIGHFYFILCVMFILISRNCLKSL